MPLPSLRGALATKQSRGRVMRPLDCFAALAMTVGSWLVYFWASPQLAAEIQTDPLPAGSMGRPVLDEHLSASRRRGSGFHDRIRISRVALAAFLELRRLVVAPRLDTSFRGYESYIFGVAFHVRLRSNAGNHPCDNRLLRRGERGGRRPKVLGRVAAMPSLGNGTAAVRCIALSAPYGKQLGKVRALPCRFPSWHGLVPAIHVIRLRTACPNASAMRVCRLFEAAHVGLDERRSAVTSSAGPGSAEGRRELRNDGADFSFHKTEYVLGSKFSRSGSLLRHERALCPTTP